ncbi:1691_t:CDS:2, partial [Funneliformis geosporum]
KEQEIIKEERVCKHCQKPFRRKLYGSNQSLCSDKCVKEDAQKELGHFKKIKHMEVNTSINNKETKLVIEGKEFEIYPFKIERTPRWYIPELSGGIGNNFEEKPLENMIDYAKDLIADLEKCQENLLKEIIKQAEKDKNLVDNKIKEMTEKTKISEERKKQIELEEERKMELRKTESLQLRESYLKETPSYELLKELKERLKSGAIIADDCCEYPVRLREEGDDNYLDIPYILNNECGSSNGK